MSSVVSEDKAYRWLCALGELQRVRGYNIGAFTCPRCGGKMLSVAEQNPVSAAVNTRICYACSCCEIMARFAGRDLPYARWAFVRGVAARLQKK